MRINLIVIQLFIVLFLILCSIESGDGQTEWLWSFLQNPYVISLDPLSPAFLTTAALVKLRVAGAIATYAIQKRKEWITKDNANATETPKTTNATTTPSNSTTTKDGQKNKGPYPNSQNAMQISLEQIHITTPAPSPASEPSMQPPPPPSMMPLGMVDGGYRNGQNALKPIQLYGGYQNKPEGMKPQIQYYGGYQNNELQRLNNGMMSQPQQRDAGYPGTGYRMSDSSERLRSMDWKMDMNPNFQNARMNGMMMQNHYRQNEMQMGPSSSPRPYMNAMTMGRNSYNRPQMVLRTPPPRPMAQQRIELRPSLNIFPIGRNRKPNYGSKRAFHENGYESNNMFSTTTKSPPSLMEIAGQKLHFTIPRVEIRPSIELFPSSLVSNNNTMDSLLSIVKNHTEAWVPSITMPSLSSIPNPLNMFSSSTGTGAGENGTAEFNSNNTSGGAQRRMDEILNLADSWLNYNPLSSIYSRVIGTTTTTTTTPRSVMQIIPAPDLATTTTTTTTSTTTPEPEVEDEGNSSSEEANTQEDLKILYSNVHETKFPNFLESLSPKLIPPFSTGLEKAFHAALLESKPFPVTPTMPEMFSTTASERSTTTEGIPSTFSTTANSSSTEGKLMPEQSSTQESSLSSNPNPKAYSFPMINPYGISSPFQQFPFPQVPNPYQQFPMQTPYGLTYPQFQNPYMPFMYPGAGTGVPNPYVGMQQLQSLMALMSTTTTTTPKTIVSSSRVKESKSSSSRSKRKDSDRKHHHRERERDGHRHHHRERDREHYERKSSSKSQSHRHEKKKHSSSKSKSRRTKRTL